MRIDRRAFLAASTVAGMPAGTARGAAPRVFSADWSSLVASYTAPDWFRDAKFGIWAHWTAQCVPEAGDWYAREMYIPGTRAYDHHRRHYGHPADIGFMEMNRRWKAENWDPARLLDLYQRAGARYFMALANHHDNFDTYASSSHPWNAMRIGPRRDIVGIWAKLARERGLRFAVSNHSAHAWHWFQPAYGYDPDGPRAGARYDASTLTAASGRGKWWDGLDPRALYCNAVMPLPAGLKSGEAVRDWHEAHDRVWDESVPAANPGFAPAWRARCRELIDRYRPDMLYFDNMALPLERFGLEATAYLYNRSMQWHDGRLEAVVTAKSTPPERRRGIVDDVERGAHEVIQPHPWQTDTCLGNWHYDRELYERGEYKTAATVIHTLCDVVSKNGNLMLSVPMRGDGTIDEKEEAIVEEIAGWMERYGAAIHGSRPWRRFGEGPTRAGGGNFAEGGPVSPYTARDVRYVAKAGAVHALVLGWPEDRIAQLSMLGSTAGAVERVSLPGDSAPLSFRQTSHALEVDLPSAYRNAIGVALVVRGPAARLQA